MKNIGIIVKSLNDGGAERAAANLSKDLSEKYNVYLILFDITQIAYPYSGTIIDLKAPPTNSKIKKIYYTIKRILKVRKIKRKYNFKATISFMLNANIINVLTKQKDKVITSVRNTMSEQTKTKLEKKLIIWTGKKADMTVSLSNGVRDDLIENFGYEPSKIVTIYNSCDKNFFTRENKELDIKLKKIDYNNPVFVMTGRHTYQKGQWHALRAISIVKHKYPYIKLLFFGEGELTKDLKVYCKKLKIDNNVEFMGYVKNYHNALNNATAFLFPSLFEGLGNVLLEALACGVPIISTNCPFGPKEILNPNGTESNNNFTFGEYGILTPNFSKNEFNVNDTILEKTDYVFANAMIELIENTNEKNKYERKSIERAKDFLPEKIKYK